MIQLDLSKEVKAPISFSLSKVRRYIVELYWESAHDLDAHAIALKDGKLTCEDDILSTYNNQLVLTEDVSVNHNPRSEIKKPFQNLSGSLMHSGDARTGLSINAREPDEIVIIDTTKIDPSKNEISFFVTSHPPCKAKFNEVKDVKLLIKNDEGEILLTANLKQDFDQYDMVQMGSLMLNPVTNDWEFSTIAVGLNGQFNNILSRLQ